MNEKMPAYNKPNKISVLENNVREPEGIIKVYADGSCHTQLRIGSWAVIIRLDHKNIVLKGIVPDTTHNNMELMAVIKALDYLLALRIRFNRINIYSDSQYVVNIRDRKEKLKANHFLTKKGKPVQNAELVQKLIRRIETHPLQFIKVAAHKKHTDEWHRKADQLVRNELRQHIAASGSRPI